MEGLVFWAEPLSAISLSRNAPFVKQTMIKFYEYRFLKPSKKFNLLITKRAGPILALPLLFDRPI
jgi:hypothetical protein